MIQDDSFSIKSDEDITKITPLVIDCNKLLKEHLPYNIDILFTIRDQKNEGFLS